MRVLVCGGRDYDDLATVFATLDAVHAERPISMIIEGGAEGADYLAARWSVVREIPEHRRFTPDWAIHGKAAGPVRNQRMLDEGKPDLVVAFPGGRGTDDMTRRAIKAGIGVHFVPPHPLGDSE